MSVMDERHVQRLDSDISERTRRAFPYQGDGSELSVTRRDSARKGHSITIGAHTLDLPQQPTAPPGPAFEQSKRVSDAIVASLLILLLLPLLGIVALGVFLEDGGSIFYYQMRVGRHGRPFRFYKFRSMVRNADAIKAQLAAQNEASGPIFKMRKDPRITRIGRVLRRYSVDELPQLVNVVRGEMSLIGPRPHLPSEVLLYTTHQKERLDVQPGLLCFREVFGRSEIDFDQWIELDLLYIRHRSFRTDMRIICRTIPAILSAEGAY